MRRSAAKRKCISCLSLLLAGIMMSGCRGAGGEQMQQTANSNGADTESVTTVTPTQEIAEMESGLSAVRYDGDYGLDGFLAQGGASSDGEVVQYLADNLLSGLDLGGLLGSVFGCSTIAVQSPEGHALFGRNFDWSGCEALIVEAHPENGYASLSTVNMDFITQNAGSGVVSMALRLDEVRTLAALYAPLDGMNEAGLAVSVNMIQDSAVIEQDTEKPDLTTTTAIRLLLDRAATVEEALALLEQYDLHGSMGMMIHFAISDATGRSVVVEYVGNEMVATETPVVTNFYLADWIERVRSFQPNIIIGYPSAIKILAELQEKGAVSVRAVRVISCGEPLGPGLRRYLERVFGCTVVNIYGASESLALGVETGKEDGMLLFDDMNVIEMQDGIMYLTCLYNYAQPLIRYRISDQLARKEPLPGSPFTRAEILLGRSEDMLWFTSANGSRDFLHPLAVEGFCVEGLLDYQFRQIAPDAFEMLAETTGEEQKAHIRTEMLHQMGNILREKRLDYVQFYVRFVDAIRPDPKTGKKHLIVTQQMAETEEAV